MDVGTSPSPIRQSCGEETRGPYLPGIWRYSSFGPILYQWIYHTTIYTHHITTTNCTSMGHHR